MRILRDIMSDLAAKSQVNRRRERYHSDEEFRNRVQKLNRESKQMRRLDPVYAANEKEQNRLSEKKRREDPDYVDAVRKRDNIRHQHKLCFNPAFRAKEYERIKKFRERRQQAKQQAKQQAMQQAKQQAMQQAEQQVMQQCQALPGMPSVGYVSDSALREWLSQK